MMGKEVVKTRSAAEKALAESRQKKHEADNALVESRQSRHELDSKQAALTKALAESQQRKHELDSMQATWTQTKQHLTTVQAKDSRLRKALHTKERNLKILRSQLSQAVANTTTAWLENDKLMKELEAEQHELNVTRVMLTGAQNLAKDLARNNTSLGAQVKNQTALGLVTSKRARGSKKELKELKKEVVKIHALLDHDEQLLRRYRQSQKRLRARLKQQPQHNATAAPAQENTAGAVGAQELLKAAQDQRKKLMDQNRVLNDVVKELRAKLAQYSVSGDAEVEGQDGAYTP